MKRKLSSMLLVVAVFTVLTGSAIAAVHNEKYQARCFSDSDDPRMRDNPDCEPGSCGCLFHRIEEYVKELFK